MFFQTLKSIFFYSEGLNARISANFFATKLVFVPFCHKFYVKYRRSYDSISTIRIHIEHTYMGADYLPCSPSKETLNYCTFFLHFLTFSSVQKPFALLFKKLQENLRHQNIKNDNFQEIIESFERITINSCENM